MLSAEDIEKNYKKHLKIIETYISDRKSTVLSMIETLGEKYYMSPASTKDSMHNAFYGGYIDHVNRVVQLAYKEKELYASIGGEIDFTDEELVFSALFHDLGKIGDEPAAVYLPQTDKWRQEKLKEKFTYNGELDFMLVQDRSLFTLQKFAIPVSRKEYIAIRCHDGLYDDTNKPYFLSNYVDSRMKTNIVHILHTADYLASKIEYDIFKKANP